MSTPEAELKGAAMDSLEQDKKAEAAAPASFRFKDLQEAIQRLEKMRMPEWKIVKVLRPQGDYEYVVRHR